MVRIYIPRDIMVCLVGCKPANPNMRCMHRNGSRSSTSNRSKKNNLTSKTTIFSIVIYNWR